MKIETIINSWFDNWQKGDYLNLPISDDFRHTSPFGIIKGKRDYLELVEKNKDKFLGHNFVIHDKIISDRKACVRYTAVQGDFELDVSEWYYVEDDLIQEIIAYYHIGEVRKDRELSIG